MTGRGVKADLMERIADAAKRFVGFSYVICSFSVFDRNKIYPKVVGNQSRVTAEERKSGNDSVLFPKHNKE